MMKLMKIYNSICPKCTEKLEEADVNNLEINDNVICYHLNCPKCGCPFGIKIKFTYTSEPFIFQLSVKEETLS